MSRDWVAWHEPYDDPRSALALRLKLVQAHLAAALDAAHPGSIRLISACAGQGRDVLGVLPEHRRRHDIAGLLVELDPGNCASARNRSAAAGLGDSIQVIEGDAGDTASYAAMVPAHVALFCGVFGNTKDEDIRRTIAILPVLCAEGATVIWTRHRQAPDLTTTIRRWFADAGFVEVAFDAPPDEWIGVGVHRLARPPEPYAPGARMFTFTDEAYEPSTRSQ